MTIKYSSYVISFWLLSLLGCKGQASGLGMCTGGTLAQRAHWRLSWQQCLARNARRTSAPSLFVTLHGLPAPFGFDPLATT